MSLGLCPMLIKCSTTELFLQLLVYFHFEVESCYIAQAGLELEILLPQPPE